MRWIVPTNSFIATAEAVSAAGATPVLVDVDDETALITAGIVEAALRPRTRCVIPVHLYGRTVEMDPLLDLCRDRGILVIEDACQAHGSLYRGRPVGSLGDAGCFSFYPTKNLGAWGDGGAVVTSDSRLAERVRKLRSHGELTRHYHELPAQTDRLDALQAAILRVKLGRLDEANSGRRAAGAALREALVDTAVTGARADPHRQRSRLPSVRRPDARAACPSRPSQGKRDRPCDPLSEAGPPAAGVREPRLHRREPAGCRAAGW